MKGQRLPNGFEPTTPELRALGLETTPRGSFWIDSGGTWAVVTPNGRHGSIGKHTVIEHEDGTITVSPSILVMAIPGRQIEPHIQESLRDAGYEIDANGYWPGHPEWHGFLERGIWRAC